MYCVGFYIACDWCTLHSGVWYLASDLVERHCRKNGALEKRQKHVMALSKLINSQSLEDTQVGYILQKYTLEKYTLEKYT